MARLAKKTAISFELECPYCHADIMAPGGSTFWTLEEMESYQCWECKVCKKNVKLTSSTEIL